MAFDTLRSNKLRSFLTIFGVVIGVITVMLISSLISGINVAVEKEVESFGTRSIFLYKMDIGIHTSRPSREERMRKPLTMEDAEAIANLSSVEVAVPYLDISNNFFGQKINVTGKNGKTSSSVQLTERFPRSRRPPARCCSRAAGFRRPKTIQGRTSVSSATGVDAISVCIRRSARPSISAERSFGSSAFCRRREQLFGGGGGNNDQSNVIYMPMGAAMKLKPNADDLFILAVAKEGQLDKAKDDVQDLLRVRRQVPFGEKNNFSMETAASLIDQFQAITGGVFLAMVVISSVGLMIGGIGVMNIMLVSVTERTREIGIRKAIGAKQSDILLQFLIEAATFDRIWRTCRTSDRVAADFARLQLLIPSYVPLVGSGRGILLRA